jgi:hypothetical protein
MDIVNRQSKSNVGGDALMSIQLQQDTSIDGDLTVTGNLSLEGDLQTLDVATINNVTIGTAILTNLTTSNISSPLHEDIVTTAGSGNTTSTSYVDWPGTTGPLDMTFTKKSGLTSLFITYHTSFFANAVGTTVRYAIQISGFDYESITPHFQNEALSHKGYSNVIKVSNLPAGAYNLRFRWKASANTIVVDGNDFATIHCREAYTT